jgi:hypothetical protein
VTGLAGARRTIGAMNASRHDPRLLRRLLRAKDRMDAAAHEEWPVEFTQEPVERYGTVDAGFRDPSGNGWKMIQAARGQ